MKRRVTIILVLLAVVFSVGIVASTGSVKKTLLYSNIKVTLNDSPLILKDSSGKEIEPFTIDGVAYIPVSAFARALGLNSVWDGSTNTIKLTQSSGLKSGTVVFEDQYVKIEFVGCQKVDRFFTKYEAIFNVTNKNDIEITLQPSTIAFNGISYQFSGSEEVAPKSTGRIAFYPSNDEDEIPIHGIKSISGTIKIIDFNFSEYFNGKYYHEVKWVNVGM
jgi:hypothetical protein